VFINVNTALSHFLKGAQIMKKIFFACLFLAALTLRAQNIPSPMVPARLVNDFAAILDQSVVQELEDSLVQFDKVTSTQIAIVTVEDLDGYPASDYALAILRGWGVGRQGKNNGIVLLIKPRNQYGGGNVYISVGTGLEGVLNDAKAGRIIDNYMLADLKNGDYTSAAEKGAMALMSAVRGEFTAEDGDYYGEEDMTVEDFIAIVIFLIILVVIVVLASHSGGGGSHFGGGKFNPPIFFGGSSGRSGGSFGGFGGFGGGFGAGGGAGRSF